MQAYSCPHPFANMVQVLHHNKFEDNNYLSNHNGPCNLNYKYNELNLMEIPYMVLKTIYQGSQNNWFYLYDDVSFSPCCVIFFYICVCIRAMTELIIGCYIYITNERKLRNKVRVWINKHHQFLSSSQIFCQKIDILGTMISSELYEYHEFMSHCRITVT